MNVTEKRIEEDIKKIKQLQANYGQIISSVQLSSTGTTVVRILLNIPTARNSEYPRVIQNTSDIRIELANRYPFEAPRVSVSSPIWNPNVYTSGMICLGNKWIPTQGLELLVFRVMQIVALDPLIINTSSPANAGASSWYSQAKSREPKLFPTINLEKVKESPARPKVIWKPLS